MIPDHVYAGTTNVSVTTSVILFMIIMIKVPISFTVNHFSITDSNC